MLDECIYAIVTGGVAEHLTQTCAHLSFRYRGLIPFKGERRYCLSSPTQLRFANSRLFDSFVPFGR
ncbi:hypothetical protein WI80_23650 [Burkholderia ubonensis]|nr:hypothetical protein WI80_23650 [Burkholderia ubonensis]